jgi:hypothetical protein
MIGLFARCLKQFESGADASIARLTLDLLASWLRLCAAAAAGFALAVSWFLDVAALGNQVFVIC